MSGAAASPFPLVHTHPSTPFPFWISAMSPTAPLPRLLLLAAVCLAGLGPTVSRAAEGRSAEEKELLAVLRSDAAEADKALACKKLAVHGSGDAVPDLAKLLANDRLASWARIPLEAIPDRACDAALREAVGSLSGRLLVGVINSLGVRRDGEATNLLVKRLSDPDAEVAAAAAAALGSIATPAAAVALRQAVASGPAAGRPAAAEAAVVCAERLAASGKAADAIALYDLVREADVPVQRRVEATRGAILARGQDGLQLLVAQLRSPEKPFFHIGLSTAREAGITGIEAAVAAELATAVPDRAVPLIDVLADRGGVQGVPALVQATGSNDRDVRLAAVRGLGRIGDATALGPLLAVAGDADRDVAETAETALGGLAGEKIDAEIAKRLATAATAKEPAGRQLELLLGLVGKRRSGDVAVVASVLTRQEPAARSAALAALGEVVDLERLGLLVDPVVKPRGDEDRAAALAALRTAAVRMADRDRTAKTLAATMKQVPTDVQVKLLDIVGEVAGPEALVVVTTAARSDDDALRDAGTRLLGTWLTPDAATGLLELATSLPDGKYQARAFRGYLRIARQLVKDDGEQGAMCRAALAAARSADDKKTVLDALKAIPTAESLDLAATAGQDAALRESARAAAAAILLKAGETIPDAWARAETLGLKKARIEIVKATYGAGDAQRDVTEVIRKRVGGLPLIVLAQPSYNAAFGGDPAPGTKKQLVVEYSLDGKAGKASFDEDAAILLE